MRLPHYRPEEDVFLHDRCFTDVAGTACLHLRDQHDDGRCPWCPCSGFTSLAAVLATVGAGDAA